jgi:DNA primase
VTVTQYILFHFHAVDPVSIAWMTPTEAGMQAELIVSLVAPGGRVWIAPDGDKAGERHAQALLALISPYRFVRWVKLGDTKQPTDFSAEELIKCFTQ